MGIHICLKNIARKMLMYIYANTKTDTTQSAFFISFSGKQYSDSPRAISEALHEMEPDVNIIWLGGEEVKKAAPDYVKVVNTSSIAALKAMARANVWVANTTIAWSTYKHRRVLYIQTFHGDRGFKRCGYDAARAMGEKYSKSKNRHNENDLCDVYMVGSRYGKELAFKAFDYHGRFSEYGIPRNDKLMNLDENQSYANEIRVALGISANTKILLYAPTFRDNQRDKQEVNVDLVAAIDILSRNGDKWVCLQRGHSATKELYLRKKDERILDVSHYKDMADLLLISDLLITDYSSSAPDFVLTNKPVVLAQFDLEDYITNSRALAFNPIDTGFLIAQNQEELNNILSCISNYDHEQIRKRVDSFYGTSESGEATVNICKEIMSWLKKTR